MQKTDAQLPTPHKTRPNSERLAARRARREMRILKRQERHNSRILKRREIQLVMYKFDLDPIPGWIEDMWKVKEYQSLFEDDED